MNRQKSRARLVAALFPFVMSYACASDLTQVYQTVLSATRSEIHAADDAVRDQRERTQASLESKRVSGQKQTALAEEVHALEEQLIKMQERVKEKRAGLTEEKKSMETLFESLERHERLLRESLLPTGLAPELTTLPSADDRGYAHAEGRHLDRVAGYWKSAMKAIASSAAVTRMTQTSVFDAEGVPKATDILRFGPFSAQTSAGEWLLYRPAEGTWQQAASAPDADDATVILDPTYGLRLEDYRARHSVWSHLKPAGMIGILIALTAFSALLLGAWRWIRLTGELRSVRRQRLSETPDSSNALGRLLLASAEHHDESLEARLDAALTAERPAFNRGIALLAMLAGIPTLLGLLGTVSGMIETFAVMSELGAAEPRLLAGGIAQALVTTELGLMSAIPILLLHCAVKTRRDELIAVLEEVASELAVREAGHCCGCRHDKAG